MYLIEAPKSIADRYEKKFSSEILQAVQNHFLAIFDPPNEIVYEKWVTLIYLRAHHIRRPATSGPSRKNDARANRKLCEV